MSDDFFQNCVLQALKPGYNQFDLTPGTGDVSMERHLFNKLNFSRGTSASIAMRSSPISRYRKTSHIQASRDADSTLRLGDRSHSRISFGA
jgi:hypothetical protein